MNTDRWSTSFDFAWRLGHGIQCVCGPQTSCKIRNTGILFDKGDDWPADDGLIPIFSFLFGLARCFPNMLCFFWNIQRLFLSWSEEAQDHNTWSHLLRYIWLSHVIARDMRWLYSYQYVSVCINMYQYVSMCINMYQYVLFLHYTKLYHISAGQHISQC